MQSAMHLLAASFPCDAPRFCGNHQLCFSGGYFPTVTICCDAVESLATRLTKALTTNCVILCLAAYVAKQIPSDHSHSVTVSKTLRFVRYHFPSHHCATFLSVPPSAAPPTGSEKKLRRTTPSKSGCTTALAATALLEQSSKTQLRKTPTKCSAVSLAARAPGSS